MLDRRYAFFDNEDVDITARWTDSDGTPFALSDAKFGIKDDTDATAVLVDLTLADNPTNIIYDSTDKWITAQILVDDALRAQIPPGTYFYDLVFVRDSDDRTTNMMSGELVIRAGAASA
jgi:hypothetical protein